MLSQVIATLSCSETNSIQNLQLLQQVNAHLDSVHTFLFGNPNSLSSDLQADSSYYSTLIHLSSIQTNLNAVIACINSPNELQSMSSYIQEQTKMFLPLMDKLVAALEQRASTKLKNIGYYEIALAVISVAILLFEYLYIFRPALTALHHQKRILESENEKLRHIAHVHSHEVRGPVASILGLVNLISKQKLPDESADVVMHLQTSAQKLDDVIHKIIRSSNSTTEYEKD